MCSAGTTCSPLLPPLYTHHSLAEAHFPLPPPQCNCPLTTNSPTHAARLPLPFPWEGAHPLRWGGRGMKPTILPLSGPLLEEGSARCNQWLGQLNGGSRERNHTSARERVSNAEEAGEGSAWCLQNTCTGTGPNWAEPPNCYSCPSLEGTEPWKPRYIN